MRVIIAVILSFVLVSSTPTSIAGKIEDDGIRRAYELHIPIACEDDGEKFPIGTGFPVGENKVMTAGHVDCGDYPEYLSLDHGVTWLVVPDTWVFQSRDYDIAIIVLPNGVKWFKHPAKFRVPVVGEEVSGYGLAGVAGVYGASKGIVIQESKDQEVVFVSNIPLGGFSGSAIVGNDGKVIGMINWAVHDVRVGGVISAGLSGHLTSVLYQDFLKWLASFTEGSPKEV